MPEFICDPTDPDFGKWRDWTGFSWANPNNIKVQTVRTIPAVCSSFVWQSVQNANKLGKPRITLDSAEKSEPDGVTPSGCTRHLPPDYRGDKRDEDTPDGLYVYDEATRQRVAKWWSSDDKNSLWSQIYRDSSAALPKAITDLVDLIGRPAFIVAAHAGPETLKAALIGAIGAGGPVGAAISAALTTEGVAVIDLQLANALIEILYDIPNDITTQILNAFAFDCVNGFPGDASCVDAQGVPIKDPLKDDNVQHHPGTGRAVSPDNIHMFWDPPVIANVDGVRGIYGYNFPAQPVRGVTMQPICKKIPSNGTATISGFVKYKGRTVPGARITCGCSTAVQSAIRTEPIPFTMRVKSGGFYKAYARYVDTDGSVTGYPGRGLYGECTVPADWNSGPNGHVIEPNATYNIEMVLLDPPQCMRQVIVEGDIYVYDSYVGGHTSNNAHFKEVLMVQAGVPKYTEHSNNPENNYWSFDTQDPNAQSCIEDARSIGNSPHDQDTSGALGIHVKITNPSAKAGHPDYLAVDVTLIATLNPSDENMQFTGSYNVQDGRTVSLSNGNMDTGGAFSDGRNLIVLKLLIKGLGITDWVPDCACSSDILVRLFAFLS